MRYLPHTPEIREHMLASIGAKSIDDLFVDVPQAARLAELVDLPKHQSEMAVERAFQSMASRTISAGEGPFFLGGGAYRHHIPASVDHLIQRGEFLTSYTPYQPEISQGTLQYLYEFQTQVALLFGMEVANASLYDGATATVEAVLMANRVTNRSQAVLSGALHPHYREVVDTYARFSGFQVNSLPPHPGMSEDLIGQITDQTACVVVQYPNFFGELEDLRDLAKACQAKGALLIVAVNEVVALGLVESPGEMGADIVVGEGQSLGVGLNFGGPTVGLFATREKFVRQMPGRIVGETVDVEGKRGWVLTLSTREQHIRREKATSNICTNSGLCSLAFTIHLSLLGEEGLKRLARINHAKAIQLADRLAKLPGVRVENRTFFNEITVELSTNAAIAIEELASQGFLAGIPLSRFYGESFPNHMLIAVTETTPTDHIDQLIFAISRI